MAQSNSSSTMQMFMVVMVFIFLFGGAAIYAAFQTKSARKATQEAIKTQEVLQIQVDSLTTVLKTCQSTRIESE